MGQKQVWLRPAYKECPGGTKLASALRVVARAAGHICFSYSEIWTVSLRPRSLLSRGGWGDLLESKQSQGGRQSDFLEKLSSQSGRWTQGERAQG